VADPAVNMPVREEGWSLQSAVDAAQELVHLIERFAIPGWSWSRSGVRTRIDLRATDGVEPVPLVLPDGQVLGTVRRPPHPTGDPADAALRALLETTVLAVAMERRGWVAVDRATQAERQSRLDALTGLPNRRLWDEVLMQEQARCDRHGYHALVTIVDLDDLKTTNDSHGHLAGDVLLRMAAQALRAAVRDTDLVARLGGDEFALLAVEFEDGDPAAFAARVKEQLAAADVTASVGTALAGPGEGLAEAVVRADRMMYDEKRSRKRR
jgi:diguanylate cyclase (GGDEF)-like protein